MERNEELTNRRTVNPLSEIREENGKIILKVEMPGVPKDDIQISIENDQLRIFGARQEEKVEGTYLLRERNCGDFEKIYTIDDSIDRDSVDAKMENGVLQVSLSLKEEVKPRKIEIKAK